MSTNNSFDTVQGLNIQDVYSDIDFPVARKKLVTDQVFDKTNYEMVTRVDTNKNLGIVRNTFPVFEYTEVMDWLTSEFDKAGLDFKIRDSVVQGKGDVYQEYLFRKNVETPDGSDMSPLVIAKMSYVHVPLEIHFGTYRFTCSNGVMVGDTISKIHISRKTQDLLKSSIVDDINSSLDRFKKVSELYSDLANKGFERYLELYLLDQYITAGFKKAVLEELQNEGALDILMNKIKKENFSLDSLSKIYKIKNEIDAWAFYNVVTAVTTHKSRSVGSRLSNFSTVSKIFGV